MDGSGELKEIKKEIIEARGLIIKSNNLANSLNAEVRNIAKRQVGYERHLSWSSIVAYILFVILIWAGAQLAYNYRQSTLEDALAAETKRADEAEAKLAELEQEMGPKEHEQDKKLMELYELVRNKERQSALDAFQKINRDGLTPLENKLLTDVIESFKADLSMMHYARATDLVQEKKFAKAVEEFRESLRFKSDAGHATSAKIQMANALRLLGKPREAIAILQRLMEEHLDRELSDDAYWYLALAHEDAHQKDEARSVLLSLMRQFPESQYVRDARIRQAEIRLKLYKSD